MGDRGLVEVQSDTGSVFLYTHWGGSNLAQDVAEAIHSDAGRNRWKDSAYLARIIFDQIEGEDSDSETGFGISSFKIWPDHWTIVVSVREGKIWYEDDDGKVVSDFFSFEDFQGDGYQ